MKLRGILQAFLCIISIIIFIVISFLSKEFFLENYIWKESYLKYKQIPKNCKMISYQPTLTGNRRPDIKYVCDRDIDLNYLNIPNNKKWALWTWEIYTIYIIWWTLLFFYLVIIKNYNKSKRNSKKI